MERLSRQQRACEPEVCAPVEPERARVISIASAKDDPAPVRSIAEVARPSSPQHSLRAAVLHIFREPVPGSVLCLRDLSPRAWKNLLSWLDESGLALYLRDRLSELALLASLPRWVAEDLQTKSEENAQRTAGMVAESVAIQREFQRAVVCYAVMKGVSLSPASVPRPELRHQFDLDYLVAENSALQARGILEARGYRLFAESGRTWEFKIGETPNVTRRDLYKDLPYRSVELHLESDPAGQSSLLQRVELRDLYGMTMPVLSPVDLFIGQALHAFKDVCTAHSRTSHLLELYRHVLVRREDRAFWCELREATEGDRRTRLGIGVVTYLLSLLMGSFAPRSLTSWTSDLLPRSVQLWIDLYGMRAVFASPPGTKLYLLLQRELDAIEMTERRSVRTLLLPLRLPSAVVRSSANETTATRMRRYRIQLRYVASRLRFHLVEGVRYGIESYRWRQRLERSSL